VRLRKYEESRGRGEVNHFDKEWEKTEAYYWEFCRLGPLIVLLSVLNEEKVRLMKVMN
jgi:hypothetical protein